MPELDKTYEPAGVEPKWYDFWLAHDCFKADPARVSEQRPAYSIVIPPPNVTGVLTLGHVLNNTIQDILARRARMLGKEVLWLPGTDHAGIATQNVVEKALRKAGEMKHRDDLGRDALVAKIWEWKEKYGGIIIQQLKKLGASCDWSRERFTMDAEYSRCVSRVFVDLYRKGLIYRGTRMVNWCPASLTALSDEEVVMKEQTGALYYFKVEVIEEPGRFLTIATTRPETIPGDTAVAVNPRDPRYAALIGQHVRRPLPRENPVAIPILGDDAVAFDFGTGVLKVTPAHDRADYEIGQRHGLAQIDIMQPNGVMNALAGADLAGLERFAARARAVELLIELGALEKEEPYKNNVGYSERADVPIEPRLSEQWFLKYPSVEPARACVAGRVGVSPAGGGVPPARTSGADLAGAGAALPSGAPSPRAEDRSGATPEPAGGMSTLPEMRFYPERWAKVYDHWLGGLQDWCISRQLWWGHRIPVWYRRDQGSAAADPASATVEQGSAPVEQGSAAVDQASAAVDQASAAVEQGGLAVEQGNTEKNPPSTAPELRGEEALLRSNATNLRSNATNLRSNVTNLRSIEANLRSIDTNLRSNATNLRSIEANLRSNEANLRSNGTELRSFEAELISAEAMLRSTASAPGSAETGSTSIPAPSGSIAAASGSAAAAAGSAGAREIYVGVEPPVGEGWEQDPDVLDTWFSSWLWPFATMGWVGDPAIDAENPMLNRFYPTTDLVTGPDIIFFWVARMIMAGFEYMEAMPFRNVYFTGIIRDKQGRKMSKSLGNSPDPLDLIAKYGADALRFGVMRSAPLGADILFDEKNVELGRNFCTKLWNAARFRQMQGGIVEGEIDPRLLTSDDRWILLKLNAAILEVSRALDEYRFSDAAQGLYRFLWSEFCDWYLESTKAVFYAEQAGRRATTLAVIDFVLGHTLRLFHPFLPFITEELWHGLGYNEEMPEDRGGKTIMFALWPAPLDNEFFHFYDLDPSTIAPAMDKYETVTLARSLRRDFNIGSSKRVRFLLRTANAPVEHELASLKVLLAAEPLEVVSMDWIAPKGTPAVPTPLGELLLPLEGLVDVSAERERLSRELAKVDAELAKVRAKLADPNFATKVPAKVLDEHRSRESDWSAKQAQLSTMLAALS